MRGICAHIQKLKITRSHRDMILTHTFGKQSVNVGSNSVKMLENIRSLKAKEKDEDKNIDKII